MAELDFSHHVAEVPAGQALPAPYQRNVKTEVGNVPNVQGAINKYAADTNWMSALGSEVASKASGAIAAKLGAEAGKEPHGELGPSFTEFDKHFAASYNAQAQATLGIQANKLITESNIKLASMPRLSMPEIEKAQTQVYATLQKIYSLAPQNVRLNMQQQYGAIMLQQQQTLMGRYIKEQKEDRIDNLSLSVKTNNENAHSLAVSGDNKAALLNVTQINDAVDAALKIKDIDETTAKLIKDSARQTYLSGKYTNLAQMADQQKKLPEFYKLLADTKEINDVDKLPVINNVLTYMNQQANLKKMDEELTSQQMLERINFHPNEISGTDWSNYVSNVSPIQAQKMHFKLLEKLKKDHDDTNTSNILSQHWDNATVWANTTDKIQNKTFNDKVNYVIEQGNKTTVPFRSPIPMMRDEAEVMVASGAGGEIPVFTKTVKNKLKSSNPAVVESGIKQIHALLENGNGQALSGLSDQDWSMFSAAQSLRDSPDPIKANQDAHNRIYNQDPDIEKMNKTKWANIITKQNSSGISNDLFALKTFGFSKSDFINPTLASAYGTSILSKFGNFFAISGDYEEAKESTQRWVDQNYGNTFINGGKHTTSHPIEKEVGFTNRDGVPYIQHDIVDQFNQKLIPLKELYDKKIKNEHWETIPINIKKNENIGNELLKFKGHSLYEMQKINDIEIPTLEQKDLQFKGRNLIETLMLSRQDESAFHMPSSHPSEEHGVIFKTYDPIKLKRTMRTKEGIKTDTFNVVLIGNMFGDYDVAIQTKSGMKNLFREAPFLGIMTVSPRKKEIMDHWNRDHEGK